MSADLKEGDLVLHMPSGQIGRIVSTRTAAEGQPWMDVRFADGKVSRHPRIFFEKAPNGIERVIKDLSETEP